MAFTDRYVQAIIQLEVKLWSAHARLRAGTDTEALHDLRIAVRRLRSLLVPVRKVAAMSALSDAARQVGRLTTPSRDLEVMAQQLSARGLATAANHRLEQLPRHYARIAESPALSALFTALDRWPAAFRASPMGSDSSALTKAVEKSFSKHLKKLHAGLDDQGFDRHQLRILVKRTRYLTEAFPQRSPLSPKAAKALKAVQAALGAWHDHHQWCLQADAQPDLRDLRDAWGQGANAKLAQAEVAIKALKAVLNVS